jgi:sec-independent protein translocase protein TatA
MAAVLAFMGLGPTELIIIGIIVLLLFGNRLPSVMRSLGRGVVEFKKGVSGVDDEQGEGVESGERKN